MPSPFPGVDPYIEGERWRDFHVRIINALSEQIGEQLPPGYDSLIEESVYLIDPNESHRIVVPDVAVDYGTTSSNGEGIAGGQLAVLEPVTVPLPLLEPLRSRYIEVLTRPGRELVAVVEILSPSNKSGRGRVEYLDKRDDLIRSPVHIIEIDLLLQGLRLPMAGPLPYGDYYALVSRSAKRPDCDVYAWTLRQELPTIPIPLRRNDQDLHVSLKTACDLAFARGRYERTLDYSGLPGATIPEAHRAWVAERAALARLSRPV